MRCAEDRLRRQIAARIAAKRTGDENGLEGKLLQACGHITLASLAGDHELLPTGSHLEHAGSMADEKVKVIHIKKPSPEATILRPPNVSPVDLPRRCSSPSMRLWNVFPIAMSIPLLWLLGSGFISVGAVVALHCCTEISGLRSLDTVAHSWLGVAASRS
jgi:hypothetical protein